jgi:hypothetical protein
MSFQNLLTSSRPVNGGGIPTDRSVGFPAALEPAIHDCIRVFVLKERRSHPRPLKGDGSSRAGWIITHRLLSISHNGGFNSLINDVSGLDKSVQKPFPA